MQEDEKKRIGREKNKQSLGNKIIEKYSEYIELTDDNIQKSKVLMELDALVKMWNNYERIELDECQTKDDVVQCKCANRLDATIIHEQDNVSEYNDAVQNEFLKSIYKDNNMLDEEMIGNGIEFLRNNTVAFILLAGGSGTRFLDSVNTLISKVNNGAELSDAEKASHDFFIRTGIDMETCTDKGKLFMPVTSIMRKSAFEINFEVIADIIKSVDKDFPVIVFVSPASKESVIEFLVENKMYGLKDVMVVEQDALPFVSETEGSLVNRHLTNVTGSNGGGGILFTLASTKPVTITGKTYNEKSLLDWMISRKITSALFAQTDDIKSKEIYLGMFGAKSIQEGSSQRSVGLVSLVSEYPAKTAETDKGVDLAFKLGSIWRKHNTDLIRCIEYNELTENQKSTIYLNRNRIMSNLGSYIIDTNLIKNIIKYDMMHIHIQRNKKEVDEYGNEIHVSKFEYFLPDIYSITSTQNAGIALALVRTTSDLPDPLKNLTIDALPIKDVTKLNLANKAKAYCDNIVAERLGIEIRHNAYIELGAFYDIKITGSLIIRDNSKVYFGGSPTVPLELIVFGNVVIEGNATVIFRGGKVSIHDDVEISGNEIVIFENE